MSHFVAISKHIADRIRRAYDRRAGRDVPAGRRPALRDRGRRRTTTIWSSARSRRTSASTSPSRRPRVSAAACSSSGTGPGGSPPARLAGPDGELSRLALRRRGRRALRPLPRAPLSGSRGFRDRAAGSRGRRPADDRAGGGRRARDDGGARRVRRAADRPCSSRSSRSTRSREAILDVRGRGRRSSTRKPCGRAPRPSIGRSSSSACPTTSRAAGPSAGRAARAEGPLAALRAPDAGRRPPAHPGVLGGRVRHALPRASRWATTPPFRDYALQLMPILVVWGIRLPGVRSVPAQPARVATSRNGSTSPRPPPSACWSWSRS